ncbi:MAG: hypothetical protein AAFV80_06815 [Bacteroidota bacterium]
MGRYKTVFVERQEGPKPNKFTLGPSVDGDQLAIDIQITLDEYEALGYQLFSTESVMGSVPKSGAYIKTTIGVVLIFERID